MPLRAGGPGNHARPDRLTGPGRQPAPPLLCHRGGAGTVPTVPSWADRAPQCPNAAGSSASSPRIQRAAAPHGPVSRVAGTVPAGAGSSYGRAAPGWSARGHPCGCGEQSRDYSLPREVEGPSPRVRGADHGTEGAEVGGGTIPAGAGSSRPAPRASPCIRDHPRGCGEQSVKATETTPDTGPSPRVRGADHAGLPRLGRAGTIPAGAGSSPSWGSWRPIRGDHPRGCGEQPGSARVRSSCRGPSPRVRGAETGRPWERNNRGTIPAGAGSRL